MAYQDVVLADVPSLYWRLDELSGSTATDISGNARNGTYVASPTLGVVGALSNDPNTAITTNGTSQYVTSTYAPYALNSQRSFEGWAKLTDTANAYILMGSQLIVAATQLQIPSGTKDVQFFSSNLLGGVTWTGAWPSVGQWHHWCLTFDDAADSAIFYLDGISQGTKVLTDTYGATTANLWLAYRESSGNKQWGGSLDEFAVYESILSPTKVLAHYTEGLRIGFSPHGMGRVLR